MQIEIENILSLIIHNMRLIVTISLLIYLVIYIVIIIKSLNNDKNQKVKLTFLDKIYILILFTYTPVIVLGVILYLNINYIYIILFIVLSIIWILYSFKEQYKQLAF